jgi:hypothetical protein
VFQVHGRLQGEDEPALKQFLQPRKKPKKVIEGARKARKDGAPERIRTSDPQIRSLVLYPAELRAPGAGHASREASSIEAPAANGNPLALILEVLFNRNDGAMC